MTRLQVETGEVRLVDHTQFVYRDEDLAVEFAVDPQTGARTVKNLYAHGTLGVDDPIVVYSCEPTCPTGSWLTYGKDKLNSIEILYTSMFKPSELFNYTSFGIPFPNPPSRQSYSYTCREWDDSSMFFYRARWYEPRLGVFTSRDLLYSYYLYTYTINNPN